MTFPYDLVPPIGARATLGMIVLQADETLEQDMRRVLPLQDVAAHVSRVPSADDVTPDTLAAMEHELPQAASLLPRAAQFDVVGYGCTSGTMQIGADRVAHQVRRGVTTRAVTDPLTATLAAMAHLGARRVALVTPYVASVAAPLAGAFSTAGMNVVSTISFGEAKEEMVARIDPSSTLSAAIAADCDDADVIFLSCTNLRTLDIIETVEERTGKPCLSSNLCLLWHMARLSGLDRLEEAPGRLNAL